MKKSLIVLAVVAMGVAFLFAGVYATQQAPDNIVLESKVFTKHKKALVTLSHKKHNVDYKAPCADCHHVYKEGKNVWKEGDEVKKCSAAGCHDKAKAPKAKEGEKKLTRPEKAAQGYYYSAIHENCVGCHKDAKKAGKTPPTACKDCHPKKK
ncbi:MAG: cytochrome c3 family protein [Thermodesulfobacteriota bacterium]|nr:cytochrome c3 family protein [Thermodesulfobacteriota bacterium]